MRLYQNLTVIILSAFLLLLAYVCHEDLMRYSLLRFPNITFSLTETGRYGGNRWLLMTVIALIPVGYFLLNAVIKARSLFQSTLYVAVTFSCGMSCWWLRLQYMKNVVESARAHPLDHVHMDVSKLQFEQYSFIGILIGVVVSGVLWKLINRKRRGKPDSPKRLRDELIDQNEKF